MAVRRGPRSGHWVGFSLVEVVVVLAIMALLATIGVKSLRWTGGRSQAAQAQAQLATIAAGLEAYRRAFGDYPHTQSPADLAQALIGQRGPTGARVATRCFVDLTTLVTADARDVFADARAEWIDPWGQPYRYAFKSSAAWAHYEFVLYSDGPDQASDPLPVTGRVDHASPVNQDNVFLDP